MSLVDYLKNLNTSENQWSLYVNPQNIDEFRVGQNCFENGGLLDGWVSAGTLESLSCGFQSTHDAIAQYLEDNHDEIVFNGRKVRVNRAGTMEAYSNGYLDDEFQAFLESEAESIKEIWAANEAWEKVEELRQFFAPGGEWEQAKAQAELEAQAWESYEQQQLEQWQQQQAGYEVDYAY